MRLLDTTNPRQHRAKRKLAAKMRSEAERQRGVGLFYSLAWRIRRANIQNRVRKQQIVAHLQAENRKLLKKKEAQNG